MKTVLIAEDTDSNFLLLSIVLKKKYNLVRAYNGIEAVELYKSAKPDIILMDIKMPIKDGLEATREIRQMDASIPILALTANAFDSDKQKALDAGCNGYMAKPIVAAKLMEMLDELVG